MSELATVAFGIVSVSVAITGMSMAAWVAWRPAALPVRLPPSGRPPSRVGRLLPLRAGTGRVRGGGPHTKAAMSRRSLG